MRKTLLQCSSRWVLAAIGLAAMIDGAAAGAFTRGCAARDLHILMLIEDRESTNAVSAEKLGDAMLAMMEARIICYEGRVVDALALYDSIRDSITPNPHVTDRRR